MSRNIDILHKMRLAIDEEIKKFEQGFAYKKEPMTKENLNTSVCRPASQTIEVSLILEVEAAATFSQLTILDSLIKTFDELCRERDVIRDIKITRLAVEQLEEDELACCREGFDECPNCDDVE